MKNKLFLFISFVLFPLFVQAQAEEIDYIYTKNGSLFKGTIIEYIEGDLLRLEMKSGNIIVLNDKNIRKIIQGGNIKKVKHKVDKPYLFKEKGMYYALNGSINGGGSAFENSGTAGLGVQFISGYQFNRWIGAGLGIGMDYYYPGSGEKFMPIFAEARGYLRNTNAAPYYSIQAGYGFTFEDEDRNITAASGGLMLHPAIGIRSGASSNMNFTIDIGVKYQKGNFEIRTWDRLEHKMTYRRAVLRIGVLF